MRISIKAGLSSLMAIMMAMVLMLGATAYLGTASIKGASDEISANWLPSIRVTNDVKNAFSAKRLSYALHILSLTPEAITTAEKRVAEASDQVKAAIDAYRPLISSDKERALLGEIEAGIGNYDKTGETLLELSRVNKNVEATTILNGLMQEQVSVIVKDIDDLIEINVAGSDHAVKGAEAGFSRVLMITAAVVMVAVLISVLGFLYALKGVSAPIQRITGSMGRLAGGDSGTTVPFAGRRDEIGDMAAAVEVFRQNAINNARLEQEADANRSATEAGRIVEQQRIAREAEQLRIATSTLGENLKLLARGDLTCRIDTQFAQEYEPLRTDFNATVDQLSQTISAVAVAIQNMDSGTREIATGATDLSKRTEQQAASLEETAAALDQITVNVSSSSKLTEEARSVSQAANLSAAHSAQVVSEAEQAMGRIEDSSQQISNIIGVIDEIAFQTNLLALNAGVEAARAGEAGKGFAVVAQEVRELAQRSAQAAKEIKGLIQKSTTEVEGGVKLVRDTGTALKTIGDYIAQINTHMHSIATSAQEQSTGLSQVNIAVNQMDQTTQQNAAMVEESTAAAASLSQESAKLRDLVAQFRLKQGAADSRAVHRATVAHARPAGAVSTNPATSPLRSQGKLAIHANLATKGDEWQEF